MMRKIIIISQYQFEDMTTDDRESIMTLPLKERLICIALKNIFDQICQRELEGQYELQSIRQKYFLKQHVIQEKGRQIIKGQPIPIQTIPEANKFFKEDQAVQVKSIAQNPKKINQFWSKVLTNFFGEEFTEVDIQISKSIKDIYTIIEGNVVHMKFEFGENNYIKAGVYTKTGTYYGNLVRKAKGTAEWLKRVTDGIFCTLFEGQEESIHQQDDDLVLTIINQFMNEIIPYAIQHYIIQQDQFSNNENEVVGDDPSVEEIYPNKKIKQ